MEDKDLIIRKPNPEDGRSILICLTDFGKEMRDYSKSVVLTFDQKVRENISDEDLKTFMKVANTIMDLISNRKIYNQPKKSLT